MAKQQFELPDLGEGIAEGELVSWLVAEGDDVTADQTLADVETDKAVVEVPSPYDGTVTELHADEGEVVDVDSVIVTFDVPDAEADDETAAESADASAEPSAEQAAEPAVDEAPTDADDDAGS
ncbi:biotin/lipoyl-containing protein, partial [Halobacterium bonnevillei]